MRSLAPGLWICGLVAGIALSACGGASSSLPGGAPPLQQKTPRSGSSPIQHVVFIVQENRSFDNLFADFPGADGATRGRMKVKYQGKYHDIWVPLQAHALVNGFDIQHCHTAFLTDYDNGKMDGFGQVSRGACGTHGKPAGKAVYQYVEPSQIAPYWAIANQWGLSDHMFQNQGSGSFIAHQDLIRGGSQIDSQYSLVDNPNVMPWGCDAGGGNTSLITQKGKYLPYVQKGPFPCTNAKGFNASYYQVISDLLDSKSVSWKYYSPCFKGYNPNNCDGGCPALCSGGILNAYDVIASVRYGAEWGTNVSMPETNIFTDITNNNLAAVSWVIPSDANSDHPGEGCGCDTGPSWVASIVNAIGQTNYWHSSVIVVLWDDWGGFYDHVAPDESPGWGGNGFRIPMLVMSPYLKVGSGSMGGYVSSTPYTYGSLLRYVEDNWNLGRLGTSDSTANSISDMLDYTQQQRKFTKIPSQHSMEYFEHHAGTPQNGDPE
ncbi:MAG TPA: alkaline phosphatase family protein [Candidatus Cybelea sp.]